MNQLAHFDKARQELALAASVDEVKEIRDKAELLRAYAKQSGESLEMQNQCAEIKLRAERKAGELLKEQTRKPGETDKSIRSHGATISAAEPKLEDIGINKSQSSRWQQMAEVPADDFDDHVAKIKESKKEMDLEPLETKPNQDNSSVLAAYGVDQYPNDFILKAWPDGWTNRGTGKCKVK